MANLDIIRTLTLRAKQEGFAEAQNAVGALGTAYDTSARRQLSMEKSLQALERRFVSGAKESQEFERVQQKLNLIVAQFPQAQDRVNQVLDAAAAKLSGASIAADKFSSATTNIAAGMSRIGSAALESSKATERLTAGLSQAGRDAALPKQLDRIAQGMTDATNSSKLMIQGMSAVGQQANTTSIITNKFGDATKGARYELLNLSRQLTDVAVGFQSGQGLMTVFVQQGSQIADIFATSAASGRNFGKMLLGLVTPMSVTVTSILALGAAAVTSAFQWVQAQKTMEVALLGIGRASGVTQDQINQLAESAKELSPSEAMQFATALAATGKIGISVLTDLVNVGKDTARMFGVELPDASKMLASAFADPAKGVDTLNERLNSFDGATVKLIKDLQAQGNILGAQQALLAGLKSGLQGIDATVSTTTAGWTALTNAVSGYWTKLGEVVARGLGFGQQAKTVTQLEDEIARLREQLNKLESQPIPVDPFGFGVAEDAAATLRTQLEQLLAQLQKLQAAQAAATTGAPLISQTIQAPIKAVMPELDQKQQIDNNRKALEEFERQVQATGGSMSTLLAQANITWEQLKTLIDRAKTSSEGFKSAFELSVQTAETNIKAATALAPAAKAAVAGERAYNDAIASRLSTTEAARLKQLAYTQSITETGVALSEAAAQRKLTAEQGVQSAQLEIDIMGKSLVQQKEELLNLQTKHQLEQAALAAHVEVDKAELARLQTQNKQIAALQAQKELLQTLADLTGNFINTFVSGMVEGKTATEALSASVKNLGSAITAAASKKIGESIVSSIGGSLSGSAIGSALGGFAGPIGGLVAGAALSFLGGLFDNSKQRAADEAAAQAQKQATDQLNSLAEATNNAVDAMKALNVTSGDVTNAIHGAQSQFNTVLQSVIAQQTFAHAQGGITISADVANLTIQQTNAQLAEAAKQLDIFNQRTIATARESLRGASALSDIQQAIKDLNDKAKDLQEAMIETGVSAENAAAAVGGDLAIALDKLTAKVTGDLLRSINELGGKGYLNEFADLFTKISDVNAMNIDPAIVDQFFTLSAQKIVDGAQLAGQAFDDLIKQFPQLAGVVHAFVSTTSQDTTDSLALLTEAADAMAKSAQDAADAMTKAMEDMAAAAAAAAERASALNDRMFAAVNRGDSIEAQLARFEYEAQKQREAEAQAGGQNLVLLEQVLAVERSNIISDYVQQVQEEEQRAAAQLLEQQQRAADAIREEQQRLLEDQQRAEQERIDTIKKANQDIIDYLNGLLTGQLSPLSSKAQLEAAQQLYNAQLALAKSGDITALQNITKSADTLLNASKAFFGSSAGYQQDFKSVQMQLAGLVGMSGMSFSTPIASLSSNFGLGLTPSSSASVTSAAANDNSSWAAGIAQLSALLQRIIDIEVDGNAKIDQTTNAILAQTEALTTEQRFAARKRA